MKRSIEILVIILALMMMLTEVSSSQGVIFNFSFDKSTYHWEDSLWVDNNLSERVHVQLSNHSTATLIKKSLFIDRGDRWQKDAGTRLALTLNKQNKFSYGLSAYNKYSRLDNRKVTINQIGLHQGWNLSNNLSMNSNLSYSETTREFSETKDIDQGVMQKVELNYQQNSGKLGQFRAGYKHELNILKRTPEKTFGLNLDYSKNNKSSRINFNYAGNYRQNKYFSQLNNFDQITTQNRYEHQSDLNINLKPWRKLNLDLISNYSYRRFDYTQAGSDGLKSLSNRDNLTATLYYKLSADYPLFGRSLFKTEYLYRNSDQEFGNVFSGQKIRLGELRLHYFLRLGPDDSLYASGTFSVTTYTGKNSTNLFSDRDRVFKIARCAYQHNFSPYLMGRLRGSYQYNHYINIASELSANNNHDIIYLLRPELLWSPHTNLNITQSFIMHANYIYFDFEKYADSPRNTIYRKVDYLTKINFAFSPQLFLQFSYRYRYEDFGQLVYRDQWAQRISWERKGHLPAFEMEWRAAKNLLINPGFSYERKHSFNHLAGETIEQKILEEKELFKRQRIFINIEYRPSAKGIIEFSYVRRMQKSLQFSDDDSDIITLNIRRFF